MNCKDIRPLLSAYMDGEATPGERAQVERHLPGCEDCRQAMAEYRAIGAGISAMPMPVPPASLRRDVWRAIEAREAGRRPVASPSADMPRARTTTGASRPQMRPSPATIFTSLGNGWARALPAALVIGGVMLVLAVVLLRGTITTAAAELVERGEITDYYKPVHVKFNKQVDVTDAERYTYVRRMDGSEPYTVTVKPDFRANGNTGELALSPVTEWEAGATYQVYVDCPKIRGSVVGEVMGNEPIVFTFAVAAYTPTPTHTHTPTNTPEPTATAVPPTSTPEPTRMAQANPSVPAPTRAAPTKQPEKTVAVASPTMPGPSPTGAPRTPVVPPTAVVEPTKAAPPTNTPQPTATATATVRQSATPVPTSTSIPATATPRKSTPTVTSTPLPRVSPTATPVCSSVPVRGFGDVWQRDKTVRDRVGCPAAPEGAVTPTAYQQFQRGFMFWRGDTRTIYAFIGGSVDSYGEWLQFPDTWQEGDPLPTRTPPARLFAPVRGFGKVWYNNEALQDELGWALAPETNTDAVWQVFERGNALWTADRVIRFLYSDGLYARFDDTYVPGRQGDPQELGQE